MPNNIHRFLKIKLLRNNKEAYKTYYRANTYRKLIKLAKKSGFEHQEIHRAGNPEYLAFCKPLVLPAIIFEKMINNKLLNFFKMYLVGYFIKK